MRKENDLPRAYFENKWYIREDLYVEQFEEKRHIVNKNIMKRLGNCFDSREDAVIKCNTIRTLLGVELIDQNPMDQLRFMFKKKMEEYMSGNIPDGVSNIIAILVAGELKENIDQKRMFNLGELDYADNCDNRIGDVGMMGGLSYIYVKDGRWMDWTQRM